MQGFVNVNAASSLIAEGYDFAFWNTPAGLEIRDVQGAVTKVPESRSADLRASLDAICAGATFSPAAPANEQIFDLLATAAVQESFEVTSGLLN